MHPDIVYVDREDKPIGAGSITNAHKTSSIHRIVRIILRNSKGEYLLQKRAVTMESWPGAWDQSVGGHVDVGEEYFTAAKRELDEELGVTGIELEEIGYYYSENEIPTKGVIIKRFNKVYQASYDKTPASLQDEEVSEVKWFTYMDIQKMISGHPDEITDGVKKIFTDTIKS